MPPESHYWSDEELLEQCGEPEFEPVHTFDNKPIPPHVPKFATLPLWFPMGKIEEFPLSGARVTLADFGESYRPSQESRSQCCTPDHSRPPESRFEPHKPKSFPSDIWTLACSVWATLATRSPFETFWGDEDDVISRQVQALGKLPDDWWAKWDKRLERFTEDGQPIADHDDPVFTFDYEFEDAMQKTRRRFKMETMGVVEKEALLAMLQPMLAYRPEQRCCIDEVLRSEWMIKYAMPSFKELHSPQ